MKSIIALSGAALISVLMIGVNVASASEVLGTLNSSGDALSQNSPTTGTIGGTVSAPVTAGGGGGGGGGGGNGPPVGLLGSGGSGGGAVLGASTAPGSSYSVVFPAGEASPPTQEVSTGVTRPAVYAPSRAALTGSVTLVTPEPAAVVAVDEPVAVAPIVAPAEDPGQLASVMANLGAGDLTTWVWLLLALALIIAAGTYLYSRYSTEPERARY